MDDPPYLFSPTQRKVMPRVLAAVLALFTLALVGVLATYPSWQAGLAVVAMAATIPIVLRHLGNQLAPFAPGVPPRQYLASAGWALLALLLVVASVLLLSVAPSA